MEIRIGNATFTLDGKTYHLAKNKGINTLYGGLVGFDKAIWQVNITDGKVVVEDPLGEKLDLVSFNEYAGWY